MKEFKSIDEQIQLLKNRGMIVEDDAYTILLRENYYSVINGYKDPFLDKEAMRSHADDVYRPGVSFDDIYALFKFDRELRRITFSYLIQAEAALKTATVYAFCQVHQNSSDYLSRSSFVDAHEMLVSKNFKGDKEELYHKYWNGERWLNMTRPASDIQEPSPAETATIANPIHEQMVFNDQPSLAETATSTTKTKNSTWVNSSTAQTENQEVLALNLPDTWNAYSKREIAHLNDSTVDMAFTYGERPASESIFCYTIPNAEGTIEEFTSEDCYAWYEDSASIFNVERKSLPSGSYWLIEGTGLNTITYHRIYVTIVNGYYVTYEYMSRGGENDCPHIDDFEEMVANAVY